MAEGILSAFSSLENVTVAERVEARVAELAAKYGVKTVASPAAAVQGADIVFLAVRPQDVDGVSGELKPILKSSQTLVSIVAGKRLSFLREAFGDAVHLIRVMPNLALRCGEGMCAVCAGNGTPREAIELVLAILGSAGKTIELAEKDFDAVTALSGSGPAYFAYMCEAMTEAGEALGLSCDAAKLLARQTMFGTAKFICENDVDLGAFIAGVATKGGTTAAGMVELEKDGVFKRTVAATLAAAARRSSEL